MNRNSSARVPELSMMQAMPVNSDLIETLTQIILALNEQERQLLFCQFQDPNPTDTQSLKENASRLARLSAMKLVLK